MKLKYYPFLTLILTSNLLMGQSYLSQDEVSLFGMKLMDDARDHLTLEELNSKITDPETADLFYRVPISSKKNANYETMFVIIKPDYTIHNIVGLQEFTSLNNCKEVLKTFASKFEDKYSIAMWRTETVHTSFKNHLYQANTYEGGSFRFQCHESFDNNYDHDFGVIFQTSAYAKSVNRFYDEGF